MIMLLILAVIVLCTIFNRLRGGGWEWLSKLHLPGRELYYVTPLIGLTAWIVWPWQTAIMWAASYLFWAVWAWGMIFDLNRLPDGYGRTSLVSNDPVERACMACAFGSDYLAMFWRHLMVLPGLVLIGWWTGHWWIPALAPAFAALVVLAYDIGWRTTPDSPIRTAELLTGALWGCLLLAATRV